MVRNFNKYSADVVSTTQTRYNKEMINIFGEIWHILEILFEGWGPDSANIRYSDFVELAKDINPRYLTYNIEDLLQNIIDNKGLFVWKGITYGKLK
jgi:hypothetical protein